MESKFKQATIYYFSGTGNAKFAAEEIKSNLQAYDIDSNIINIADKTELIKPPEEQQLIGFCYPTHGFNAPPIVLNFIFRFPRGKSKVFLLNRNENVQNTYSRIRGHSTLVASDYSFSKRL